MLAHVWLRLGFVLVVLGAGCSSTGTSRRTIPVTTTIAPTTTTVPVVLGPLRKTSEQAVSSVYKQGVARTPNGWIFSGTNSLWRTDDVLKVVTSINPAIPPVLAGRGFDHVGDI